MSNMSNYFEDKNNHYYRLLEKEEKFLQYGQMPVSTGTWFAADSQSIETTLRDRLERIAHANPWVTGHFVKRKKHNYICQSKNKEIDTTGMFQVQHHPGVKSSMPVQDVAQACAPYVLQRKKDFKQPFWKVIIVPGHDETLVLMSMSHAIADGHTFYAFYNMLMGSSDIKSYQVKRNLETVVQQEELFGKEETTVIRNPLGFILSVIRGFFLANVVSPLCCRKDLQSVRRFERVDPNLVKQLKQQADVGAVPFVSTNDVLCSWFFRNSQCPNSIMAFNLRGRLKNHTDDMAGCYGTVLYYRESDVQTPSLIRQSVRNCMRVVTADQTVRSCDVIFQDTAWCSNWATFCADSTPAIDGRQVLHFPLMGNLPSSISLCLIFKIRPRQLGIMLSGRPSKVSDLEIPFVNRKAGGLSEEATVCESSLGIDEPNT